MVDNIRLRCNSFYLQDFCLEKIINVGYLVEKVRGQNWFKLFNPDNHTENYLKITPPREDCSTLKIEGSIRKWYLGNTIEDLSKPEYKEALGMVFDLLNIPHETMAHFSISRIEIGLNIPIKTSCYDVEKAIIGFKSNCYKDKSTRGEGVKFKSKHFSIKLYNKVYEIIAPFKNKRIKSEEEIDILTRYRNKEILRIEFTINGGKGQISDKIGYGSLNDSIDSFENMYFFFWKNLFLLQFDRNWGCTPQFNPEGKQLKDLTRYLILLGIHQCSLESIQEWAKKMKHSRRVFFSIKKRLLEDESPNTYDRKSFYMDIKLQLIRSMHKSKCLKENVKMLFQHKTIA